MGRYLTLVGDGDDAAAETLLDSPRDSPTCQLPERAFPIPPPAPPGRDPADGVWRDEAGKWMTDFPPPPGSAGPENRVWDGDGGYQRHCTAEEAELLDAHEAAAEAEEFDEIVTAANLERDFWFGQLRSEPARSPANSPPRNLTPPTPDPGILPVGE